MNSKKKIVIIGGGISGLTTAYQLFKAGLDVTVLEKNKEIGGSMETISENGFLFDRGANSGLETVPLIRKIADEVGLKDEFIHANAKANKRYILRNNKLHALPMSPLEFIKTKLFSTKAKFRLLAEPFIGRSKDGYYQSIGQFVRRRLGSEFLDYAINPFVSGVYAGDPDELSVRSSFPKLYELEEKYGGLIVGTIRSIRERKKRKEIAKQSAKMFSFKSGMQIYPQTIAKVMDERVITFADVTKIEKQDSMYRISYDNAGHTKHIDADIVISTIPAYACANLIRHFDSEVGLHLDSIFYPPVMVLYLGYKKEDVKRNLDGFGFLIPEKEEKSFLGAIWSSTIFPNRSKENEVAFTLFVGGSRNKEMFSKVDKEIIINNAIDEFEKIMGINEKHIYKSYRYWSKAIPQYTIGYVEHERYFDKFEKKFPGLILSGNYRGGISVGDCIKNSELMYEKIVSTIGNG